MSSYARRMVILGAKIFGEVPRPVSARSQSVVDIYKSQPKGDQPLYGDYYPPLNNYNKLLTQMRKMGLYHDEYMDFVEEMAYNRKERGKGKPKKGEGKRSKKKK